MWILGLIIHLGLCLVLGNAVYLDVEALESSIEPILLVKGHPVIIHCKLGIQPVTTVTWFKNGNELQNEEGIHEISENGTLKVFFVNGNRTMEAYHCRATNSGRIIVSPEVEILKASIRQLELKLHSENGFSLENHIVKCAVPVAITKLFQSTVDPESQITFPDQGSAYTTPMSKSYFSNEIHNNIIFRCKPTQDKCSKGINFEEISGIESTPRHNQIPRGNCVSPLIFDCSTERLTDFKHGWFSLRAKVYKGSKSLPTSANPFDTRRNKHSRIFDHSKPRDESDLNFFCSKIEDFSDKHIPHRRFKRENIIPAVLLSNYGSSAYIRCGVPMTNDIESLTWFKDGERLIPSPRISFADGGSSLEISYVRQSDVGMYQCFVRSGGRTLQALSELKLSATKPLFTYQFIQQTLTPGPSVSLKCIAKGTPPPTFDWRLDGFELPNDHRFLVGQYVTQVGEVVSHVNITRTKVTDGGEYSCRAKNSAGVATHSAKLFIYGPPHIRNMGSVTAVAGETFRIRCPVSGYPLPSITWRKGSRDLPLNRRHKLFDANLEIADVSRDSDEGEYTCVATDRHGRRISQPLRLRVVEPPKVGPFTLPEALASGTRMAVQCVVVEGDPPTSLEWLHNGRPASITPGVIVTPISPYVSALLIDRVELKHSGNFTCRASSETASDSHTDFLQVNVAPYWIQVPKDASFVEGKNAQLVCQPDGFPQPSVTWKKLSSGLDTNNGVRHGSSQDIKTFSNGTLYITNVQETHEGSYLCEVSNGVGKGLSAIVSLIVHAPPKVKGEDSLEARRGDTIAIKCRAKGDSPLTLTITKHGHPVDPSSVKYTTVQSDRPQTGMQSDSQRSSFVNDQEEKQAVITIKRAAPIHTGKYTCTATNPFGTHAHLIQLVVLDAPPTPRDLRVVKEGSRTVTVHWSLASHINVPVSHFIVVLSKSARDVSREGKENIKNEMKVGGKTSHVEIKDLMPSHSYQVQIKAVNNVGTSLASDPILIHTLGEKPAAGPVRVKAFPVSSTEIKLSWHPPPKERQHGSITSYSVGYKLKSDVSSDFIYATVKTISARENVHTMNKLEKNSGYVFVIKAINAYGVGPASERIETVTKEDVPDSAPTSIECISLTSSKLQLIWADPPEHLKNGHITSYTILYQALIPDNLMDRKRKVSNNRLILGDLAAFTNYSISIAASTRVGMGVPSKPMICTTEENVPTPPRNLKAVPTSSSSIVVAWVPPTKPNGIITKYTLFTKYSHKSQPTRRILPPQTSWVEVGDLSSGREYNFWMTASTRVGESIKTKDVHATPKNNMSPSIYGMSQVLRATGGNDISLSCPHAVTSESKVHWTFNRNKIDGANRRWREQLDGSLSIRNASTADRGNITCNLVNSYGSDEITYEVKVAVVPTIHRVNTASITSQSILTSWKLDDDGGYPVSKFILSWQKSDEDWNKEVFPWHVKSHKLDYLSCGSNYKLYLTAYNSVGGSKPTEIRTVQTKGDKPSAPSKMDLIFTNATSAFIRLTAFTAYECPISHFNIKLKPSRNPNWLIDTGKLPGGQKEYLVPNLTKDDSYTAIITAFSDAGQTEVSYTFSSTSSNYADNKYEAMENELTIPPWKVKDNLYTDPAFIVPVIISCIALIVIAAAISICLLKKPAANCSTPQKRASILTDKPTWPLWKSPAGPYDTIQKMQTSEHNVDRENTDYVDDVNPYATFQLKTVEDTPPLQSYAYHSPRRLSLHQLKGPAQTRNHIDDESPDSHSDQEGRQLYRADYISANRRNTHHNILYASSDRDTMTSPDLEGQSLPRPVKNRGPHPSRKSDGRVQSVVYMGKREESGQAKNNPRADRNVTYMITRQNPGVDPLSGQKFTKPGKRFNLKKSGSSDGLQYSETECSIMSKKNYSIAF